MGVPGRGHLGLHVAQVQQHCRHLVGGVGGDTGLLDRADDGVVVAHQPGAAGPADQRVRQADPRRPTTISACQRLTTASSADLASP